MRKINILVPHIGFYGLNYVYFINNMNNISVYSYFRTFKEVLKALKLIILVNLSRFAYKSVLIYYLMIPIFSAAHKM